MNKNISLILLAIAVVAAPTAQAAPQASVDRDFAAMDLNKDGRVEKAEYAKYREAVTSKQTETIDAAMTALDVDKDGKISRAESAVSPELSKYFDALDGDKDGFLSRPEMQTALAAAQATAK